MAKIIKGNKKGIDVELMDIRGEIAVLGTGAPMRQIKLGCLEATAEERQRIIQHYENTETFNVFYDWGWFLKTNRFKRINWTLAQANQGLKRQVSYN